MRTLTLAGMLAAATALCAGHANATLTPTLEFTDGPVASVPNTTGNISFGGVTVNGAPIVGSATQKVLQLSGTMNPGIFNPLGITATEFNLLNGTGKASVEAKFTGTLAPLSSLTWSVYLDPHNNPLGTAQLIASDTFSDTSSTLSESFTVPPAPVLASVSGPFSLSEFVTISDPANATETFSSSVVATAVAAPEPVSLAILGSGLLALGLIGPTSRRRSPGLQGSIPSK